APGARGRHRRARGRAGPAVGVAREPAGRPVLESHQRAPDAARRGPRSRAVRGCGDLRPPGAGAAPDRGAYRADRAAALDGAGSDHARVARRRAARPAAVAAAPARDRGAAVVPGRDALRGAGLFTAVLV